MKVSNSKEYKKGKKFMCCVERILEQEFDQIQSLGLGLVLEISNENKRLNLTYDLNTNLFKFSGDVTLIASDKIARTHKVYTGSRNLEGLTAKEVSEIANEYLFSKN